MKKRWFLADHCLTWGILWRQKNKLDGDQRYLIHDGSLPITFRNRSLAKKHIEKEYGYIRKRPDLKIEPHGWKMPVSVRVKFKWTMG